MGLDFCGTSTVHQPWAPLLLPHRRLPATACKAQNPRDGRQLTALESVFSYGTAMPVRIRDGLVWLRTRPVRTLRKLVHQTRQALI